MIIYTLIYCSQLPCEATDSFSIKIRDTDDGIYKEIFNTGTLYGRTRDSRWNKETIFFRTSSQEIFVNKLYFYL